MSQSNYSKIESDKQDASPEQIEAFAQVLGISPASLAGPDSPFYNIENQHGGHANNYFAQNGIEVVIAVKDDLIAVLKDQIQGQQERIQSLEEDNRSLRGQLQKGMAKT